MSVKSIKPPQAIDAEKAVLGSMLLEKDGLQNGLMFLKHSDVFYDEKNVLVFDAIKQLHDSFYAVDLLTVTQQLISNGTLTQAGGAYYVTGLTNCVNSAVHIEFHCQIIIEKWMRRKLIQDATESLKRAYDESEDIFDSVAKSQTNLLTVQETLQIKKPETGKVIYRLAMDDIAEAMHTENGITGIPAGILEIDKTTGGWQDGDLVIIAGRPGMGKTTFALNCVRNAIVDFKQPGIFFSLEMTKKQLMKKLIAAESGYSTSQLSKGNITNDDLARIQAITSKTLFTDELLIDDSARTMGSIKAKMINAKTKNGIKFAVLDYLQLVQMEGKSKGNREQEVAEISRQLKLLAVDLNIPIIALCQMSRAVEGRPDRKPQLSDLRESGAIEQDADGVIFIFRPEYYKITEDENGNSLVGIAEIIFSKYRNGPTGSCFVKCDIEKSKFSSMEESFTGLSSDKGYNPNKFTEPLKEEEPWRSSDGI